MYGWMGLVAGKHFECSIKVEKCYKYQSIYLTPSSYLTKCGIQQTGVVLNFCRHTDGKDLWP